MIIQMREYNLLRDRVAKVLFNKPISDLDSQMITECNSFIKAYNKVKGLEGFRRHKKDNEKIKQGEIKWEIQVIW